MIGKVINERYRIDSVLGEGGMGTVYRAYDILLQRDVAIKVLNQEVFEAEGQSRLMREAQIVSRLKHPHIVTIFDAGHLGKTPFIVMEMVTGPTLREKSTNDLESSLTLVTEICAALEHAHQAGVIHRDLKPENVLLENGEAAKLVDFGLAQTVDMKSVGSGMFAGTYSYVSPEQIVGNKVDRRADLYSLGVMLYELITSELPFQSEEILPLLQQHLTETPLAPIEKIPDLPVEINDLVLRLLSKDPDDRPGSAWDVYRVIEKQIDIEDNYLISLHADRQPAEQKNNLPRPPTSFIGRARELKELSDLLSNPDSRLLTILGVGGMGKTRLSIEVGRAQVAHFEDGVYFIPLAPLKNSAQIPFEIAEGVGLQFSQDVEPRQQLLDFFKNKRLLLVMDNFEHLLDGVEIIADILLSAEKVTVLASSRQKLGLSLEQIYRLEGLAAPGEKGDDSTQLFEERARLVEPSFAIAQDNFTGVLKIVRYVGGMPLGIELAASWVETMTIEEIAAEMRESLDFFESELQDMPERHRNMRAVIDQTWALLTLKERDAFRSFGVFRGRFTRFAVKEISGIDAKLLRSLINKSVIQRDQNGYYQIHELMRQFAEEKLAENPENNERTRDRHADYFCRLVAQHGEKILAGENYLIAPMYENIREALLWSIAQKKVSNIRVSVRGLLHYYIHRGIIDDGVNLAQSIIEELRSFARPGEESGLVYA